MYTLPSGNITAQLHFHFLNNSTKVLNVISMAISIA